VDQIAQPVGAALAFGTLISTNRDLLEKHVDREVILAFINLIKQHGPQSRLMEFFSRICTCEGKSIKSNQRVSGTSADAPRKRGATGGDADKRWTSWGANMSSAAQEGCRGETPRPPLCSTAHVLDAPLSPLPSYTRFRSLICTPSQTCLNLLVLDVANSKKMLLQVREVPTSGTSKVTPWTFADNGSPRPEQYLGKAAVERGFKEVCVNWEGISMLSEFKIKGRQECSIVEFTAALHDKAENKKATAVDPKMRDLGKFFLSQIELYVNM
jgi:hypothetical protein